MSYALFWKSHLYRWRLMVVTAVWLQDSQWKEFPIDEPVPGAGNCAQWNRAVIVRDCSPTPER